MNKLPAHQLSCHNEAWVNHIKKVLHKPENSGVSSPELQAKAAEQEGSCSSRWERQLQGSD